MRMMKVVRKRKGEERFRRDKRGGGLECFFTLKHTFTRMYTYSLLIKTHHTPHTHTHIAVMMMFLSRRRVEVR